MGVILNTNKYRRIKVNKGTIIALHFLPLICIQNNHCYMRTFFVIQLCKKEQIGYAI